MGHISENLQVTACSVKQFELLFSKMLKLDEKESLVSDCEGHGHKAVLYKSHFPATKALQYIH